MNDLKIPQPLAGLQRVGETQLQLLLDNLPAAAYTCDADGLITYCNARAVELWGRAPLLRDPKGRYCGSVQLYDGSGGRIAHADSWMARALQERREYVGRELVIERPDGQRRRVLAHATPLHDQQQRLVGAVNVLVDITETLQTHERLHALLDGIDDHFVQYDSHWRYSFVTEKGAAMLGKRADELLGRCIWEVFPDAVGNPYYEHLHEAARTRRTVRFEHYYPPFRRWYDNHVYPVSDGVIVFAVDITERKRTELAWRAAEQRQQALLDIVPVGIYCCEAPHGTIRYFNRRAAELWGREPQAEERYCGSLRLFRTTGEPLPHEQCPMVAALAGTPVENADVLIERPDGSRVAATVNIAPLRDEDGRVTGAINVFQDVSERRREELARTRLAAIVSSSHDAIVATDIEGRVTLWNGAARELYGYEEAEILGECVTTLYPPERAEEERRIFERIRTGERIENFETISRHKNGALIEVSVTVSPIRDDSGAIVGASSVAHDIRERKSHERALRRSEARYRSLIGASGAIVFSSDAQARWLRPLPDWEAYTGQRYEQYRGHGWLEAIHPEDRATIQATVAAAVASGNMWQAEGRLWHEPSRSYRHQEARSVAIRDADGRIREWVGTCQDVHARRTAEDAVRDADRRKDEFLAVLAHELRNPLAPIASSIQVLRMQQPAEPAARVLDVMDRQLHHLVRLIDDLMEVSRITRGTIELRMEPLQLDEAVQAAVEITRDLVAARGHRLEVGSQGGPAHVLGDRVRLTQIIANLLNNAAKYTPPGGVIRITVGSRGTEAVVSVRDSGVGIDIEQQKRIFDMFSRAGAATGQLAGGLGIGLALARRLAELHAGTVDVFSAGEGCGSEFTLHLPLALAAASAPQGAGAGAQLQAGRRVLVVDDNRDAAGALAALLQAMGHEATAVHDGETALREARSRLPQVVLLDLGMPRPDGFEVARMLRALPGGDALRLVAVTGWGQRSDRERSQAAGFDLHLVKPLRKEELEMALAL